MIIMLELAKRWWKAIAAAVVVLVIVCAARYAWNSHGREQYAAGYAQAQSDQMKADELTKARLEQEQEKNDREAQARIDQARNDAIVAADRAGRLQQQLSAIRSKLEKYSATVGAGSPARDTAVLLADVLSKSIDRNRELAEYADRAAEAGRACEKQYKEISTSTR